MPEYVLNRDFVLATLSGHRIAFKKGQSVWVPPRAVPEAVAIGATPADGSDPNLAQPAPKGESAASQDPEKRKKMLLDAVKLLVDRNDPDDFGADNAPKVDAIRQIVNFKLDARERNDIWQTYHDMAAAGALL